MCAGRAQISLQYSGSLFIKLAATLGRCRRRIPFPPKNQVGGRGVLARCCSSVRVPGTWRNEPQTHHVAHPQVVPRRRLRIRAMYPAHLPCLRLPPLAVLAPATAHPPTDCPLALRWQERSTSALPCPRPEKSVHLRSGSVGRGQPTLGAHGDRPSFSGLALTTTATVSYSPLSRCSRAAESPLPSRGPSFPSKPAHAFICYSTVATIPWRRPNGMAAPAPGTIRLYLSLLSSARLL